MIQLFLPQKAPYILSPFKVFSPLNQRVRRPAAAAVFMYKKKLLFVCVLSLNSLFASFLTLPVWYS